MLKRLFSGSKTQSIKDDREEIDRDTETITEQIQTTVDSKAARLALENTENQKVREKLHATLDRVAAKSKVG
jgi:hypothetical protein